MSKLRLRRDEVYHKICRLLRLPPSAKNTNAFFTREQLTLIANYIEKKEFEAGIKAPVGSKVSKRLNTYS
jgi:hypothetical protein